MRSFHRTGEPGISIGCCRRVGRKDRTPVGSLFEGRFPMTDGMAELVRRGGGAVTGVCSTGDGTDSPGSETRGPLPTSGFRSARSRAGELGRRGVRGIAWASGVNGCDLVGSSGAHRSTETGPGARMLLGPLDESHGAGGAVGSIESSVARHSTDGRIVRYGTISWGCT